MITGSATESGQPVYMRSDGSWTTVFAEGWSSEQVEQRDHMLRMAQQNEKVVCDPYVIEVSIASGMLQPGSLREQIRATGPTVKLPSQRT